MELNQLCEFKKIIIQCHDYPDADTIASGYALQEFFKFHKCQARLVYGGESCISKPNMLLMLQKLNIHPEYIADNQLEGDLLITVDCQYGAGNVTTLPAKKTAVIDHHIQEIELTDCFIDIRPEVGSCATIIWDLLTKAHFPFADYPFVCTALYYGLYTDTGFFSELEHPLDKSMAEALHPDLELIHQLKNTTVSHQELSVVSNALANLKIYKNFGIFPANACDPNILGFTSDIAQQVDKIDCCIVYCLLEQGWKLSIRSAVKEIKANEFAAFLTQRVGSGGGNVSKAGGFIKIARLSQHHPGLSLENYLKLKINDYLANQQTAPCKKEM